MTFLRRHLPADRRYGSLVATGRIYILLSSRLGHGFQRALQRACGFEIRQLTIRSADTIIASSAGRGRRTAVCGQVLRRGRAAGLDGRHAACSRPKGPKHRFPRSTLFHPVGGDRTFDPRRPPAKPVNSRLTSGDSQRHENAVAIIPRAGASAEGHERPKSSCECLVPGHHRIHSRLGPRAVGDQWPE
jgi:hypothetical protein